MIRTACTMALLTTFLTGCSTLADHHQRMKELSAKARSDATLARWDREREQRYAAKRLLDSMPTCSTDEECSAKWDAAQAWIATNAGMKLQTVTNVVLETYAPYPTTALAARAVKSPLSGGEYRLDLNVWCANFLGCAGDPERARSSFIAAVNRAG